MIWQSSSLSSTYATKGLESDPCLAGGGEFNGLTVDSGDGTGDDVVGAIASCLLIGVPGDDVVGAIASCLLIGAPGDDVVGAIEVTTGLGKSPISTNPIIFWRI